MPRTSELLTPAIGALLGDLAGRQRQRRAVHAVQGRFGDVIRGWSGQAEVVRKRLVDEIIAARLILDNQGEALRQLAASEFWASLPDEPRQAIGSATLTRAVTNASASTAGNFSHGVVAAGARLRRGAFDGPPVSLSDAEYETTAPVVCGLDDTGQPVDTGSGFEHTQSVVAPIQAIQTGPGPNAPAIQGITGVELTLSSSLFDKFTVTALEASGGTLGPVDAQVLALARAMARGYDGPTTTAALAGCLLDPGVRRAFPHLDTTRGILRFFTADESWASSARHQGMVKQALFDFPWIGFGCRVGFGSILNIPITLRATVALRGRQYEADAEAIKGSIRQVAQTFFDDRPDIFSWRLTTLGGRISVADRRVLTCLSVEVLDANGLTVAEPASALAPDATTMNHYMLISNGVEVTFGVPE